MGTRRISSDRAGLHQYFKWTDGAIGSPGVLEDVLHQSRIQEKVSSRLSACHSQDADQQDVACAVHIRLIGDRPKGVVPRAGMVVSVDGLLPGERMLIDDDGRGISLRIVEEA